jgi:hypothetical protein
MTATAPMRLVLPGICLFLTAGPVAGVRAQCLLDGLATPDVPEDSYLGQSVSIDGDRIAAGAPRLQIGDEDIGAVYVFRRVGAAWVREAWIVAPDAAADWYFGSAVSLSGDRLAIGAEQADTHVANTGAVYVYEWVGDEWVLEDTLVAGDADGFDYFGCAVHLHGDLLVVGARRHTTTFLGSGAVYVCRRTAAGWEQEQKLTQNDPMMNHFFGSCVAATDEFILVGTRWDDDLGDQAGAAYVFRWTGDTWVQEDKLRASDGVENDYFGRDVAIEGEWIAVGADGHDGFAARGGAVYMFRREGGAWVQRQKLGAADIGSHWELGQSVDMDGSLLVAGAEEANGTVEESGAAYVYRLEGSTWTEIAKVWPAEGEQYAYFGNAVGIEGPVIAVGEYYSSASALESGRVHAFAVADDCNDNGEPDLCDVAAGGSGDCDGDGVPDECEADCDADGTPDDCEADADSDGAPDDCDNCPATVNADQADADGDGFGDACDDCPDDINKTSPGVCGCGEPDTDTDGDGVDDCLDDCPDDPNKTAPGACGCGVADADRDADGTPDCFDQCPDDPDKIAPSLCGCGVADVDTDDDGILDCLDNCPDTANPDQADADADGIGDACTPPPPAAGCGACGTAGLLMMVFSLLGIWVSKGRLRRS